jgi:azurin
MRDGITEGDRIVNVKMTLTAAACALALAACGNHETTADETGAASTPAPATSASEAATQPAPATTVAGAASSTMPASNASAAPATPAVTPGSDKSAAVVENCSTQIEGTDGMQFDVGSIAIPASCSKFTITLKHTGTMPVAAMGHNVVIATSGDMAGVLADGIGAGVANDYVKPGDTRVVAHTKLVGGGQSTSVSFDTAKLKDGGPYEFFCSFPGHATVMKGPISVG